MILRARIRTRPSRVTSTSSLITHTSSSSGPGIATHVGLVLFVDLPVLRPAHVQTRISLLGDLQLLLAAADHFAPRTQRLLHVRDGGLPQADAATGVYCDKTFVRRKRRIKRKVLRVQPLRQWRDIDRSVHERDSTSLLVLPEVSKRDNSGVIMSHVQSIIIFRAHREKKTAW